MSTSSINTLYTHLSEQSRKLIHFAEQYMKRSKDPYHDVTHIERMLQDLQQFLQEHKNSEKTLNLESVILSIYWHDVWKSHRVARNALEVLHHQILDGVGSAELFERAAKAAKISKDLIDQTAYSIRKHATFQFLPLRTEESKLLKDLDDLELLSVERFEKGKHLYILAAPWRLKIFKRNLQQQKLFLPWTNQQKEQRTPPFIELLDKLLTHRK
jgi:hypothetical protein